MSDYLATADVWTVLDLIVAEFTSDPTSTACFDSRLVKRAIELNRSHKSDPIAAVVDADLKPLGDAVKAFGRKLADGLTAADDALIDKGWETLKAADVAAKGSPRDIIRTALDPFRETGKEGEP
jgi:hypothetical protein